MSLPTASVTDRFTGRIVRDRDGWWVQWFEGPVLVDADGPFESKELARTCFDAA